MLVFAQSGYFHDLLDSFALGVVILNARGRIYAVNAAAAALLGHSREKLLAAPDVAEEIFAGVDDAPSLRRYLRAALRREQPPGALRLRYAPATGPARHLSLTVSHLIENEKVFGIMLQITDVTEIVALHERERAILDEKYRVERERVESLRKLSSAVAHQLRNPAMSIGGLAGLVLKKAAANDPNRPFVSAIRDESRRLETIVAAVSEATAPLCPRPSPFSLRDLVQSRLAHIQAEVARTGPPVTFRLSGGDVRLCQDPDLMGQALDELLRNAAEFSPRPAEVAVTLAGPPGRGMVTVRNQGPGITPEIAPYLFDPFFTTKAVGVGMGLCRARRIMAALGGEVRIDSQPSGGVAAVLEAPQAAVADPV